MMALGLSDEQVAAACSTTIRTLQRYRRNLRVFGAAVAPRTIPGLQRRITVEAFDGLLQKLIEKPGMYLDEMAAWLFDEFGINVCEQTISKELRGIGWSKKAVSCHPRYLDICSLWYRYEGLLPSVTSFFETSTSSK